MLPIHVAILAVKVWKILSWLCKANIEADTTECVATLALADAFKAFNWLTVLPVVLIKFAIVEPIPVIAPAWALFVTADSDALVSNALILVPVSPPPKEDDKFNILISTDVLNVLNEPVNVFKDAVVVWIEFKLLLTDALNEFCALFTLLIVSIDVANELLAANKLLLIVLNESLNCDNSTPSTNPLTTISPVTSTPLFIAILDKLLFQVILASAPLI